MVFLFEKFVISKNWWKFPTKWRNSLNPWFCPNFFGWKNEKKCVGKEKYWSKFSRKTKGKNLRFIVLMKLKLYSLSLLNVNCMQLMNFQCEFKCELLLLHSGFTTSLVIFHIRLNNVTHSHGYLNMTLLFKPKLNLLCKASCQHMLGHINGWCLLIMNHTKLCSKLT
jgi:hypothetical protein